MTVPIYTTDLQGVSRWKLPNGDLHRDGGPAVIHPDGGEQWFQNGKRHRDDGPAMVSRHGAYAWYLHGQLHRDGGPALKKMNGEQEWRQYGDLHRDDGPARTYPGGKTQEWYQRNMRHRTDGPTIVHADGSEEWRQNDMLHRLDGPAKTYKDGSQEWHQNDKLHRDGGPAAIFADGRGQWWQNGWLHRTDGPALISTDNTTRIWFVDGYIARIEAEGSRDFQLTQTVFTLKSNDFSVNTAGFKGARTLLGAFSFESTVRTILLFQEHPDFRMLHDSEPPIAAAAAWQLPVNDNYVDAALNRPVVRDIMRYRSDVPDYVWTFMEVAA